MWGSSRFCSCSPLVSIIHSKSSKELSFYLFTDHTTLTYAPKTRVYFNPLLNLEFAKVSEWLKANKLTLNIKKSNFVTTELKNLVKYIGILIDSDLSRKHHTDYIRLHMPLSQQIDWDCS